MLGRVGTLYANMADLRSQKWDIEVRIVTLSDKITFLENHFHLKYSADSKKYPLDFQDVIIPELETRVRYIEKHKRQDLRDIKAALAKCKADYEIIFKKFSDRELQLQRCCKEMREYLPALRAEINAMQHKKNRVASIAELDSTITMKWLIQILDDIRRINEEDLAQTFLLAAGKKLNMHQSDFSNFCKSVLGLDIENHYDRFVKKPTSEMTQANVRALMQNIIKEFQAACHNKLHINSKTLNEQAWHIFCDHLRTQIYLVCALNTFNFTDDVQMSVGMAQQTFVLFKNLNEAYNPYVAVSVMAGEVRTTSRLEPLLRETATVLNGLYLNSLHQIPPFLRKDGQPTDDGLRYICDQEDKDLHKWKPPLTKMKFAVNDRLHYLALSTNVCLREQQLTTAQKSAWLTPGVQDWLLQQPQLALVTKLPLNIFLYIATLITGLSDKDTADLYYKSSVAMRKTYMLNDLHKMLLFHPSPADTGKTRSLLLACEKANTRNELVKILDEQAQDALHRKALERHYQKLQEIRAENPEQSSMKL